MPVREQIGSLSKGFRRTARVGTISVESDEKQGTVFTVDLPVRTHEVFLLKILPQLACRSISLNNAVPVEEEELEKNYGFFQTFCTYH